MLGIKLNHVSKRGPGVPKRKASNTEDVSMWKLLHDSSVTSVIIGVQQCETTTGMLASSTKRDTICGACQILPWSCLPNTARFLRYQRIPLPSNCAITLQIGGGRIIFQKQYSFGINSSRRCTTSWCTQGLYEIILCYLHRDVFNTNSTGRNWPQKCVNIQTETEKS